VTGRTRYVVVAVGLDFEERLALGVGHAKVCRGRGPVMAEALAAAIEPGCNGIISFGIAGGLDPRLRAGAHVVASSVIGISGAVPTDARWSQALLKARPDAVHAPILGVDEPVTGPVGKMRKFHRTGAVAVDMESHIAADVATGNGLPFAVFRVIADPAHQKVPRAALSGMRADGSLDRLAVLRAMLRAPAEIAGLVTVARHTLVARLALTRAHRGLGRGFGLADFG
jgi:adenosylhomocysteine nucleosidase